jgi:DNA mismatch repair ATPase MutS
VQDLNRYVAISEEFPNSAAERKSGALMHDRKVARVITPGTLIDEKFMDPYENNFLLAIHVERVTEGLSEEGAETPNASEDNIGLAWLDLSTGDFYTQSTNLALLPSAIARIGPRETVVNEALQSSRGHGLFKVLEDERYLVAYHAFDDMSASTVTWNLMLETPLAEDRVSEFPSAEIAASNTLLSYAKAQLQGLEMKLQPPVRRLENENMGIDKSSMRGLEIKTTLRDGLSKGSLFHAIKRTVTKSGARLLNNWLSM